MGWGAAGRLTCGSGEFCLYGLSLDPVKVSVSVNRCLKERQQQTQLLLSQAILARTPLRFKFGVHPACIDAKGWLLRCSAGGRLSTAF